MVVVERADAIREALAAVGTGVGCHYRLRAEHGLTVELLDRLGTIKPIRQRIPTCDEHPCPLRDGCRHAPTFADGQGSRAGGRSGKKFRLAPAGLALLEDAAVARQIDAAVAELPLSRRVLAALTDAGGALTVFALNAALLEESLAALLAEGEPGEASFTRGDLAATLALLDARGLVTSAGHQVRLAAQPPAARP